MAKQTLTIVVEWRDLPTGPVDDMRPYQELFNRRALHIQQALQQAARTVEATLIEPFDVSVTSKVD